MTKKKLNIDEFLETVSQMYDMVESMHQNLFEKKDEKPIEHNEPDRWFDLKEFCLYHPDRPSRQTVYNWCRRGLVPVHKGQKKLRFLKSEVDKFLLIQGRRRTKTEIAAEADAYLNKRKGGSSHGKLL